jgi:hypothetical protein
MKISQALSILQQIPSDLPVFVQIADEYGAGDTNTGFSTTYDNYEMSGLFTHQNGRYSPTHNRMADLKMPEPNVAELMALLCLIGGDSILNIEGIYCLDTRVELVLN